MTELKDEKSPALQGLTPEKLAPSLVWRQPTTSQAHQNFFPDSDEVGEKKLKKQSGRVKTQEKNSNQNSFSLENGPNFSAEHSAQKKGKN